MATPSTKQRLLIAEMEQQLGIKFKGSTVKEASKFISEHMRDYKAYQQYCQDLYEDYRY